MNEKQLTVLNTWCEEEIEFNLNKECDVPVLYEQYVAYSKLQKATVPLRKKTFVTTLKQRFRNQPSGPNVLFFYKEGSKIQGITHRSSPSIEIKSRCQNEQ